MSTWLTFHKDDVLPPYWMNQLSELLSPSFHNIKLAIGGTAQTLRLVAGAGEAQAGLTLGGLWRWRTTNHDVTHPGGAAGQYDVWAMASANSFSNSPAPFTDNTDHLFYIVIRTVAAGAPTGNTPNALPIAATRKIGEVEWDGTNITGVRVTLGHQAANADAQSPGTNVPAARWRDSAATLLGLLSAAGQLQLPITGSAGGLLIGGDATLYRGAASRLRTGGDVQVDGQVLLNAAADVSIQRPAAGALAMFSGASERVRYNGTGLGFFGVTPVARPAARTVSNAAAALRAIDRNSYTTANLFDIVATIISDLQGEGLFA